MKTLKSTATKKVIVHFINLKELLKVAAFVMVLFKIHQRSLFEQIARLL